MNELNDIMDEFIDDTVSNFSNNSTSVNAWDLDGMNDEFIDCLSIDIKSIIKTQTNENDVKASIKKNMNEVISYKKENLGSEEIFNNFVKFVSLKEIDKKWREHLNAMDQMREGINLRA